MWCVVYTSVNPVRRDYPFISSYVQYCGDSEDAAFDELERLADLCVANGCALEDSRDNLYNTIQSKEYTFSQDAKSGNKLYHNFRMYFDHEL